MPAKDRRHIIKSYLGAVVRNPIKFKLVIALATAAYCFSSLSYAQLGLAPMPKQQPKMKEDESTGPSLEETTKWIKQKIEAETVWKGDGFFERREINIKGCELVSIRPRSTDEGFRNLQDINVKLVPLAEIDVMQAQAMVERDENMPLKGVVILPSMDEKNIFTSMFALPIKQKAPLDYEKIYRDLKAEEPSYREIRDKRGAKFSFNVSNLEVAERVVSAIKHAATLCKAKVEKENAVQPKAQKSKELF